MKLSVIIVSWNVKDDLLNCLGSVRDNRPSEPFEIIVSDNNSRDSSVLSVRQHFPEVAVIANERNLGFAAANNIAIAQARGQYILLLNPDTIVRPGALDAMMAVLDGDSEVGAVGPRLLLADGRDQPPAKKDPTFRDSIYHYTLARKFGLFRGHYRANSRVNFRFDLQADVTSLSGAACMVRASLLKELGGLDERFFMYCEDVDLCYRIHKAGFRQVYAPQAVIIHAQGRSSEQISAKKDFYMLQSRLLFFSKHRSATAAGLFKCFFKPAVLIKRSWDMLEGALLSAVFWVIRKPAKVQKARKKSSNARLFLREYAILLLRQ